VEVVVSGGISFRELDSNNDGRLTQRETKRELEAEFGSRMSLDDVTELFGDVNGFNADRLETNSRDMVKTEDVARLLVRTMDSRRQENGNGNGTVSVAEARKAGLTIDPEEPEVPGGAPFRFDDARGRNQTVSWREAARATIDEHDLDGDGEVDEDEWDEGNLGEVLGADFIMTDRNDSSGIGR
jgi:hypothetical protein